MLKPPETSGSVEIVDVVSRVEIVVEMAATVKVEREAEKVVVVDLLDGFMTLIT